MGKGVLIAEDAAFMRMTLKNILTRGGYEVAGEAGNGEEAVKRYSELKPAVVLMDITMPVMDGVEALKKIMALDPSANVLMVSAMGQQSMVTDAIRAGAKDFVLKPYNPERVLGAVKKFIG